MILVVLACGRGVSAFSSSSQRPVVTSSRAAEEARIGGGAYCATGLIGRDARTLCAPAGAPASNAAATSPTPRNRRIAPPQSRTFVLIQSHDSTGSGRIPAVGERIEVASGCCIARGGDSCPPGDRSALGRVTVETSAGTRAASPSFGRRHVQLVAVLVTGRTLEVVGVRRDGHAPEAQRLHKADRGDVARVDLSRYPAYTGGRPPGRPGRGRSPLAHSPAARTGGRPYRRARPSPRDTPSPRRCRHNHPSCAAAMPS